MVSLAEKMAANIDMSAFSKADELKKRLWFTVLALIVFRVGTFVPLPGIDPTIVAELFARNSGGLLGMFNMFAGGALERMTIFALNIMPYISASIIVQLGQSIIPSLQSLKKEGEAGHRKIVQYTRYLTIVVCLVQGIMVAMAMVNPARLGLRDPGMPLFTGSQTAFVFTTVVVITCTTMVFMWLGEQVTERGIGNGVSIIITINIVSRLPHSVIELVQMARALVHDTDFLRMFLSG